MKKESNIFMKEFDKNAYFAAFDVMQSCVVFFDKNLRVLYANPFFAEFSGLSVSAIKGCKFNDIFQIDYNKINQICNKLKSNYHEEIDNYLHTKNNTKIFIKLFFKMIMLKTDKIYLCSFRDINREKKLEYELIESKRMLNTLMSNVSGMVYRCHNDRDWTMEFVSEGCEKLTGYSSKQLTNGSITFRKIIHPEDIDDNWYEIQKALASNKPYRTVFRVITASGDEKWVLEQGVGIYNKSNKLKFLEGFLTDVTEQKKLENRLLWENKVLRSKVNQTSINLGNIIGQSDAMQQVYNLIIQAAASKAPVIVYGESGTGKELVAKAIHELSERRDSAFVAVNCAAIPENLIESEFFGYKKGAFSGASSNKPGYMELANNGTLFLDEIGEISTYMQAKLLRALEGSGYIPIGGSKPKIPDIRIISATNRDLLQLVKDGLFRKDFFYRINVLPIELPPLRERRADILLLISHFIKKFSKNENRDLLPLNLINMLQNYNWPGNVRELQNVIQRYITTGKVAFIEKYSDEKNLRNINKIENDEKVATIENSLKQSIDEYEKRAIQNTLTRYNWHRGKTSIALGIDYRTLTRKIKKYELDA